MSFKNFPTPRRGNGFTLVEILVVLAIISILIAFAVPALEPAIRGSKLKQASDDLERALATAQQVAITDNTTVQFRIYKYDDPGSAGTDAYFHSYRAFIRAIDPKDHTKEIEEDEITVVDRVLMPVPFVIAEDSELSSLVMNGELENGTEDYSKNKSAEFVEFEFRSDGSTNLTTVAEAFWTLTILRSTDDQSSLPKEFVTLLLDPYNGRVKPYQL
jgi:uncharacterized protein (TIGR02596 family)